MSKQIVEFFASSITILYLYGLAKFFEPKTINVAYENNDKRMESVYSKRIRAGKRRTYFFDVRATRSNDYYLTITESRKKFNEDGYDRHKIFLYKEDFNKFLKALTEAVDYVKTELMPDFDFDAYNHDQPAEGENHVGENHVGEHPVSQNGNAAPAMVDEIPEAEEKIADPVSVVPVSVSATSAADHNEEVDKW